MSVFEITVSSVTLSKDFHQGQPQLDVVFGHEPFLEALPEGELMKSVCLKNRDTMTFYKPVRGPLWVTLGGGRQLRVVIASPTEVAAAKRGVLWELKQLEITRQQLYYAERALRGYAKMVRRPGYSHQDPVGVWEEPVTGATRIQMLDLRDRIEDDLPRVKAEHIKLVDSLRAYEQPTSNYKSTVDMVS